MKVDEVHEAEGALAVGNAPEAAAALSSMASPPVDGRTARGLALRALARACCGRTDALADAAAVEAWPLSTPRALARAGLARAIVHANVRADLERDLAASKRLILVAGDPRDRTLVRALTRLAATDGRATYRASAPTTAAVGTWLSLVAPPLARWGGPSERAPSPPRPSRRGRPWISREPSMADGLSLTHLLAILVPAWLISVIVPAWPNPMARVAVTIAFVFMGVSVARVWRRDLRQTAARTTALATARRRSALGVGAPADLAALAKGDHAAVAEVHLHAAERSACECDWSGAREHLEATIRSGARAGHAADNLVALARSNVAAIAAAQGHEVFARSTADELFPSARIRVDLYLAARTQDWTRAADAADRLTDDMDIPYRDDLVAHVARAMAGRLGGRAELDRLLAELYDDPQMMRWVDATAPGARAALQASVTAADP